MVFDEKLLCFSIFPGPDNLKNGDNSKSPKNELQGFAMQQENGYIYDFSSGYNAIAVSDILDIHKCLMKKNEIV